MMPGLDGFELLRALRDDPATRSLPIVMLSARAGDEARAEGLMAGVDDYLVKPFSARELLACVSSRLAARATQIGRETEISELRKTVDYNERFTAILGHDLRNPLNAIMTTAQLLQRRGKSPDITTPAARIELAAERMARMISQLLDLARLRVAGGLQLATKHVDLGQVCRQVLDELRSAHPDARIELATTGDLQGRWDGDRLAQVISNLAGNAIEHGTPDGPVHVGLADNGTAITLHVKNPGAIAGEVLPTLFDPFRGATHRHEKTRGLGLGLYISQQVVTAHRGTINVRSNAVEGTCFEIHLPRETA
jgi:two-component system, sensor histidine kinase and response regulator